LWISLSYEILDNFPFPMVCYTNAQYIQGSNAKMISLNGGLWMGCHHCNVWGVMIQLLGYRCVDLLSFSKQECSPLPLLWNPLEWMEDF
jgi:hypothetical protein